jgi:hypothetical protein
MSKLRTAATTIFSQEGVVLASRVASWLALEGNALAHCNGIHILSGHF